MTETVKYHCLNSFHLKLIAIVSMTIDHVGAALISRGKPEVELYFRLLGRLAFPIFCFLIVEGYFHTRNVYKYMLRLLVFAILSEAPFDVLFNTTGNLWAMQNVFGTLFLGLVAIFLMDKVKDKWGEYTPATNIFQVGIVLLFGIIAYYGKVDYAELGIGYLVIFYLCRGNRLKLFSFLTVLNLLFCGVESIQMYSVLSVPILALYNGERGPKVKYLFYVYYPLHLMVLVVLCVLLFGTMPTNFIGI